jgi:hypothetical protein
MATWRKFSGLIAAIILAAMGSLLFPLHPFLGGIIACLGLSVVVWQGWFLWTNRANRSTTYGDQDPYDLNRLWEMPEPFGENEESPEQPDLEDEALARTSNVILCRHCGEAVTRDMHACPFCKNLL